MSTHDGPSPQCRERLLQARKHVDMLHTGLRLSLNTISEKLFDWYEVKASIPHLSRIFNDEDWYASEELVKTLERLLHEFLKLHFPVRVIHFCPHQSTAIDSALKIATETAISSLLGTMLLGCECKIPLPHGVDGAIGILSNPGAPDVYVVVVDPKLDATRARVVAHELRELADSLHPPVAEGDQTEPLF